MALLIDGTQRKKTRFGRSMPELKYFLIAYKPQPGPVGLPRSRSSWDRGHPCPQTVLAGPQFRTCRGLEARAPRREARDSAKPRGRAEDRA